MTVSRWDGRVLEISGDIFTAEVIPADHAGPEMIAEYSMSQCGITVAPGDLLIVTPESVVRRDLGVWSKADLDAIRVRARERSRLLRRNVDQ